MTNNRNNKRKPTAELSQMVYGKVPPQAKDMEEAVLGAIMMEKTAYDTITDIISTDCFYVDAHQRIYRAMQRLTQKNQPIDLLTVQEELRMSEELEMVGGPYYLTRLTNAVVSAANIVPHARIIYERYLKREMIRIGSELVSQSYEDGTDAFELIDDFEIKYQKLSAFKTSNNTVDIVSAMVERMKRLHQLQNIKSPVTGIPFGYERLDAITHGAQKTDLIILAARPSVGKTAFALNVARNAAGTKNNEGKVRKVLFFSLEMSTGQLVDRLLAAESEMWIDKISTGYGLDEPHLKRIYAKGVQPLSSRGIYIDDTAALNVFELRSKVRQTIRKHGGPNTEWLIVIDYLQLMSGVEDRKINNREQEISNISRNLKMLAKELEVPVIALSQLSRAVENRRGEKKTPQLSDLRESGAIEQDADTVMFMYRPEYYDITAGENGEDLRGLTELSIEKHRHGSLAKGPEAIKLRALLHIQKFTEWDGNLPGKATQAAGVSSWVPVNVGARMGEKDDLPFV